MLGVAPTKNPSEGGARSSMMASKSVTALPSVISVMAEKTVIAMKCHTRGFEKVVWPVVAIILTSLTLVCLAVATGTPVWVDLKVFNGTEDRGYIQFGLFSGSHNIRYSERPITNPNTGSYYIFERFTLPLNKLYATFALSVVAMVLSIILIIITFLNSYQTVTTWWKGPPMMYLTSLFTALCAFAAISVFLDFYIWELNTTQIFIDSTTIQEQTFGNTTSFAYLLTSEGYIITPALHYSFGLHAGASVLPLLVVLISWRLSLLLPLKPHHGVSSPPASGGLSTHNLGFETEMGELNVTYASPNDATHLQGLQPPVPSYENEVLY